MSKSHRYSNVERSNQSPCVFFLKSFGTQKYIMCLFLQRANCFARSQSCLNFMSFWIVHMSVIRQLAVGWLPSRPFESLSYHNWSFIRWDHYTPDNTVSGMFTTTGKELWTSLACSSQPLANNPASWHAFFCWMIAGRDSCHEWGDEYCSLFNLFGALPKIMILPNIHSAPHTTRHIHAGLTCHPNCYGNLSLVINHPKFEVYDMGFTSWLCTFRL